MISLNQLALYTLGEPLFVYECAVTTSDIFQEDSCRIAAQHGMLFRNGSPAWEGGKVYLHTVSDTASFTAQKRGIGYQGELPAALFILEIGVRWGSWSRPGSIG